MKANKYFKLFRM